MKNFPHQINHLPKLTRALGVFARLMETERGVADDGIMGDALARAKVYTFRTPSTKSIGELLKIEHRKSPASQGTRTCARELRRFFILLGFIRQTRQELEITASAKSLLTLDRKKQLVGVLDIWRQALLGLELRDSSGASHPYQILLRLVATIPGLPKPYAGLCLEAQNDSNAEFRRIQHIATRSAPSRTMNKFTGTHMAKNSIKILPAIAEQLEDIREEGGRLYISDWVADVINGDNQVKAGEEVVQKLVRSPYAPRKRVVGGQRREQGAAQPVMRSYDPDRVGVRFNAHEDCLDRLSKVFPANVGRLQAVYDLLLVTAKVVLLVEAKTIRDDARRQVRTALGQLFFYEHFDVAPLHPGKDILRLVLTDQKLTEDLQKFLTKYQVGVVWMPKSGKSGGTDLGFGHLRNMGAIRTAKGRKTQWKYE